METQSKFIDSLYFEFSENLHKFVQDREIDQQKTIKKSVNNLLKGFTHYCNSKI